MAATVVITTAMRDDFAACMAILKPADVEPFKADLRDVVRGYGREYAARWIAGWRTELEANGTGWPAPREVMWI
jgi:hypothetical protein